MNRLTAIHIREWFQVWSLFPHPELQAQTATTKRPLASNDYMPRWFQFIIGVVIAAAIAWVLISPAPDELPGTMWGRASLLLVAALQLGMAVAQASSLVLAPLEINRSHRIDILAITCTRLC